MSYDTQLHGAPVTHNDTADPHMIGSDASLSVSTDGSWNPYQASNDDVEKQELDPYDARNNTTSTTATAKPTTDAPKAYVLPRALRKDQ
jgi:hypothetical protein